MQRAISPASAPSSALTESSAPGVSMTVTSGSPSSSARRMPRRACRSAAGPERGRGRLTDPVLADEHARLPVEPGQGHEDGGVLLALLGAVERDGAAAGVPQQVSYAEPLGRPGQLHRLPDRPARRRRLSAEGQRRRDGRVHEHGEGQVQQLGQVLGGDHCVDHALLGEVLGLLDAGREGVPLERFVDLGPEEARRAHPARPRSRARATPTRHRRRPWSGGAGARGRAARQPGAPSRHGRSPPSRRRPACLPASGSRRRRWSPARAGPPRSRGARTRRSAAPPPGRSSHRGRRTR